MKAKMITLLLALCASSCSTAPSYVAADNLTYLAIAPAYRNYLMADNSLTDLQRKRRLATVDSWRKRITAALQASGQASTPER